MQLKPLDPRLRGDDDRGVPPFRVGGFEPFTTTDYPGALAAVVFCQGCPWRCGYCHNPHLIPARGDDELDFPRVVAWLGKRVGLLDAVVFSGGEPTLHSGLGAAIDSVRALGFAIGLHTSGAYPRRLASILGKLDWIGLDVKAPRDEYRTVTGAGDSGNGPFASLDLVRRTGIAHEVRTTVDPRLTPADALERLAGELAARGVERWVLQRFRAPGAANQGAVWAAPHETAFAPPLLARLARCIPAIEVRA